MSINTLPPHLPQYLPAFIVACQDYLANQPNHPCGFCFWSAGEHLPSREAYALGGHFSRLYPTIHGGYVDNKPGPTPTRKKFVAFALKRARVLLGEYLGSPRTDPFLPFHDE